MQNTDPKQSFERVQSTDPHQDTANYYEYYLFVKKREGTSQYQTDIGKTQFEAALKTLSRRNIKHFQKSYKEYKYGDIVYHNHSNEETHVHRSVPTGVAYANGVLELAYQRQKLSIINVPALAAVDDVLYVKHLVFKISNRTFINAVAKKDTDGQTTYTIYINYNHDLNVDTEVANKQLADTLGMFNLTKPVPTC